MANQTVRRRAGGTGRQRTVAAAARAAAKRAERAQQADVEGALQSDGTARSTQETESAGGPSAAEKPGPGGAKDVTGEATTAKSTTEAAAAPAATPGRRSDLVRVGLALVVAAGLAATILLGTEYREAGQTGRASEEAVAAARAMAPEILSYDHRRLDRDFAAARKHLTGGFREEYARTTSRVVKPTAEKYKGSVKATVARPPGGGDDPAVSVVSASPDKVVVLLFMNQITESAKISTPRVDLNRVRMTLVRTSDGWKASAVDAL
ncbi:hypothetical protein [Streptomyces meridianus]|uniref:Mce-associated membrane protein n=1 Tax=Streptomyces meridianus TaxID=2938945 RepID=A0ABT0X730_9ACTN|nr:hypothetical protein [Streptomyces meridianus]MCM2578333.1 hypothetical protein [Streptomyces meridianus]